MINLENLSFSYNKEPVLNQLNCQLESGKIYGLLGKNGSGKSTLLKCLSGLIFPKGKIDVLGHLPQNREPSFLSEIFFVPETFYLPDLPNKKLSKYYEQLYPRFSPELFNKLLNEFELEEADRWAKLSFGQRKKVLISLGIAIQPKILLLDEPTNGLDIPAKSQLTKTLARHLDKDQLVIISTHHVKDIESLLDAILILDQGRITVSSSIEAIGKKFLFSHNYAESNPVFYAEDDVLGKKVLASNPSQIEGQVDVELFYKAYHYNGDSILKHLNQASYENSI